MPMYLNHDDCLILRPAPASKEEFAEQILAELIEQGLSGVELLNSFRARQLQIKPAIEAMLNDARSAAQGKGYYSTYEDVFEAED